MADARFTTDSPDPAAGAGRRAHPLAVRRARAYALDAVGYLGVAAATVPLGMLVRTVGGEPSRAVVLALSAIPPLVATVWAARAESSTRGATWGKRRLGLRVVADEDSARLPFGQALVRNAAKIGVPWQLGHTVAVGAAFGGFDEADPLTIAATAVTYPLLAVMIGTVTLGSGRGIHDRLAQAHVTTVVGPPPDTH